MELSNLQDLYLDELRDLLSVETQLTKALPKMAKKAQSDELREAFESHLEETQGHIERLKQIFENLDEKAKAKFCKGMQGILEEGKDFMDEAEDTVMDAGLIASAQRAEHYEISGYGTLKTYAKVLGDSKAVKLLQQNLDEEIAADKKLSKLAESGINVEAAAVAEAD